MKQSQLISKTRKVISQQDVSINAQLLERGGFISKLMAGVYTYLPLGFRVLSKIEAITRQEMDKLGGQELLMPALQPRENWDLTGRWDKVDVLYKIKVDEKDFCLGPTHEEIVTPVVKDYIQSYKDLPKAVYQIQTKFRNEPRPKSGLLRGREFRMKDLYSFHAQEADLDAYYKRVTDAYLKIFARCGLGETTYLTYASGGVFSKYSHEFQALSDNGEDTIFLCKQCKIGVNQEIIADQSSCPSCGTKELTTKKSIEVGNIFKLMTRFSQAFNLTFTDSNGAQQPVLMGCYGLGTSRLIGAVVESLHDERGIIWPVEIAPYQVHLISLLKDQEKANSLYQELQDAGIEVLYDDRTDIQAGEKFADADLLGMPWRLVISSKTLAQESVELKARTGTESVLIPLAHISKKLNELLKR